MIKITTKYEGKCIRCRNRMYPGETALWTKGFGIMHEKCNLSSIYSETKSEGNPFEDIGKHSDKFHQMKELMESVL